MSETNEPRSLAECVDNRAQTLRVDRDGGVIRGVKLLGLTSSNGRRYTEQALATAVPLYEGAKVNVNHAKGGVHAPRDYEDRIGVVRGVQFRSNQGLFADLHFNPKHALADQLAWDAEHASENVGLSHSVLARTRNEQQTLVVEAIARVVSVDLVADPATTRGLFEQHAASDLSDLSLDRLHAQRPDLVEAIIREQSSRMVPAWSREQEMTRVAARTAPHESAAEFARSIKR
jgi:hypothetical protein